MPIFEYVCEKCGENFEKLQKSDEAAAGACPKCGASEVKKQLSSFSSSGASSSTSCFSGG